MRPARPNSGFTLLETILALALTALVVGMLATIARQWLMNWNTGRRHMETMEMTTLAGLRIANDVGHAIHVSINVPQNSASFVGTTDQIFVVKEPEAKEQTEHLIVVNYQSSKDFGIIRRVAVLNSSKPLDAQRYGDSVFLLPATFSMTLSYRDLSSRQTNLWQDQTLPAGVMLKIMNESRMFERSIPIQIYSALPAKCSTIKTYRDCLAVLNSGTQMIKNQSKEKASPDTMPSGQKMP